MAGGLFITPVLDQEKSLGILSKKAGFFSFRRKIIKTSLFYLPLYIFDFKVEDSDGKIHSEKISVDAIKGEFAFYTPSSPGEMAEGAISDFSVLLTQEKAERIAQQEFTKLLLKHNLRRRRYSKLISITPEGKLYYPFRIGYFKRKKGYDFVVIDAVNGTLQGIKMKPIFMELLLQL